MMNISVFKKVKYQSALLIVIVFIIDLIIPLGVAVGVLYVCCIALLIRERKRTLFRFSVMVTFLILVIPWLTFSPTTTWMAFVNRGISILAIWIVYFIALQHSKLEMEREVYIQKLQNKNKELEQFTYIASHDLQEPLRSITNFSGMLRKSLNGEINEKTDKCLNYITQASNRMSNLVKDLLDYGRIGRNKDWRMVNSQALLREVLDDLNTVIDESNATFDIENLPDVYGSEVDLRLLFQNLISNGIKFRKKEVAPKIKISAHEGDAFYKFIVEDNGIGIEEEDQERVFKIFQRLHNQSKFEGTGIGLAHCKKIVDLHGGEIWVDSTLDKGSTFNVLIKKT